MRYKNCDKTMKNFFQKTNFYFLLLLIVFIPFQSFLVAFLTSHTTLSGSNVFWFDHWYEPILIMLFIISIFTQILPLLYKERIGEVKNKNKLNWILISLGLILLLSIISILFFSPTIGRGLEGFRFSFLPLLAFAVAYLGNFNSKDRKVITNSYLLIAILIGVLAIIERFLPYHYWSEWAIINPSSNFGWGFFNAGKIIQSASIIGAPNQLASYLLPAIFITFAMLLTPKNSVILGQEEPIPLKYNREASHSPGEIHAANYNGNPTSWIPVGACPEPAERTGMTTRLSIIYYLLSIILVFAIFLTFSRSALVGLTAGLILAIFALIKSNKTKIIILLSLLLASCFLFLASRSNAHFSDFLTHGNQTGHQDSLKVTMAEINERLKNDKVKFFFGSGLSTAGPVAIKYGRGIVSESWYLQIFLELGLIGLLACLVFIGFVLKGLYANSKALFLSLVAVSITALFLHTFADNPALSYSLFILIGLNLGKENEKNIN